MKWIFTLLLIQSGLGLTIPLTSEICFRVQGGQQYIIEYVISGIDEQNVIFKAIRGDHILLRAFNKREFSDIVSLPPGQINLCVQPTDRQYKTLSIDFYPSKTSSKNIVLRSDIDTLYKELARLYEQLQVRYRNQHFQSQRDYQHRKVLDETERKIQWIGTFKVGLLFISALAQLWIIKGFFKQQKPQPYEAVIS